MMRSIMAVIRRSMGHLTSPGGKSPGPSEPTACFAGIHVPLGWKQHGPLGTWCRDDVLPRSGRRTSPLFPLEPLSMGYAIRRG